MSTSTLETEAPVVYSNDEIDRLLESVMVQPPSVRNDPRVSLSPISQPTRQPPALITEPISTIPPE